MPKPSPTTYFSYFQKYIDQVAEEDLSVGFKNQLPVLSTFLQGISEEKSKYAYAEGKGTIKEVLQHITDTERIFCYRALAIARGEKANLPGFEEDDYAKNSNANSQSWQYLIDELLAVRKSTELLFNSFSEKALLSEGKASNNKLTVASIGFILLGHFYHHKTVIEERYL
jgi:uncharacterized damage-inducible protein DinB